MNMNGIKITLRFKLLRIKISFFASCVVHNSEVRFGITYRKSFLFANFIIFFKTYLRNLQFYVLPTDLPKKGAL